MTAPAGFERLLLAHAVAVARSDVAASVRGCLINADGTPRTIHEFASRQPQARELRGRGPVYAVTLPHSTLRVVVRHNRRGGLLAPLLGDRFLSPTRAPRELELSLDLAKRGIRTPEIVAYAVYPPGSLIQRADVCSREIPSSRDLAQVLMQEGATERTAALAAASRLVAELSRAGARHHDLNAKNILLSADVAHVLDVDRVTLGVDPRTALEANVGRLVRSLRKWRDQYGAHVSESDITELQSSLR